MNLSINDFRCFHRATDIPLRPINILVGENSSGKTSLLAALRFLLDLLGRGEKASFNKDPFFLGSYEQIAHYRGGRFGRAKEFSFGLRGDLPRATTSRLRSALATNEAFLAKYELRFRFVNKQSVPAPSSIEFTCGRYGANLQIEDQIKLTIRTPSVDHWEYSDRFSSLDVGARNVGFSYLDFVLRDLRYMTEKIPQLPDKFFDEVAFIGELLRAVRRTFPIEVYASAPVRSKPERTYNPAEAAPAPSGEHIPFVLAQIKSFDKPLWSEVETTLSAFGKASGLFDDVNIRRLTNTEGGPFQLMVTLSGAKSNIIDVGYGVSQALPIIADLTRARHRTLFLFQQPEVHLHPRAQAELATFFAQIVRDKRHMLFVETHSDYLIDRFRIEARDGKILKPEDVSILFFERTGLDITVHSMSIDDLGNVRGAPATYRDFFIREEFRSLGANLK